MKPNTLPEGENSIARLSKCCKYRYTLTRYWRAGPRLVWVMLNPSTADASTADASTDDATIRRVRSFTKREGYAGFVVVNVWGYRTTDPKRLVDQGKPFDLNWVNWEHFLRETKNRDVVVAWGVGVRVMQYVDSAHERTVAAMKMDDWAKSVCCLGFTKAGYPRHPLMLKKDTPLVAWPRERNS